MNVKRKHLDFVLQAVFNDYVEKRNEKEYSLYETDGTCLFELRSSSGGITSQLVFYIILPCKEINREHCIYSHCVGLSIDTPLSIEKLKEIISEEMNLFREELVSNKGRIVSMDGGELGTPEKREKR